MSWSVKYKAEIKDFIGTMWKIEILEEDYAGGITEIGCSRPPVEINHLDEGDEEPGIKTKEWILNFNNTINFQFLSLFTGTARDYLMKLYKDDGETYQLIGIGWVDPDNYSEEFVPPIYPSQIHVHDALAELRSIPFVPPNDMSDWFKPLIWYFTNALAMTEFDLPIWISTDIKFNKADGTEVAERTFENIYVDWRVFRAGKNSYMSYYEILEMILAGFDGLRLYQENGAWIIERARNMKGSSYDIEKYDSSGTYLYTVSFDPVRALTSNQVASPVRFGSDATLTIRPAWKKFTIAQEYGVRPTILNCNNLFGAFYNDEFLIPEELNYWTRNNINIVQDFNDSVRIAKFVTSEYPTTESLQSQTIEINGASLISDLWTGWDRGDYYMKLYCDYKIPTSGMDNTATYKMYFQVSIQDNLGHTWISHNYIAGNDPNPSLAWFQVSGVSSEEHIVVTPAIDEWSSWQIPLRAPRRLYPGTTYYKIWLKIYPVYCSDGAGTADYNGLAIRKVQLGFVNPLNETGEREIEADVNSKNRYEPGNIEVNFGGTPGLFGTGVVKKGQKYTDRYIFLDEDEEYILDWGTADAGIIGDLIDGLMKTSLIGMHATPLFKLRGSVRDNPGTMDNRGVLEDYDGRHYIATGMRRDVGACEVAATWLQIREPEQEAGGEFNWDFSNDFNIGT